MACLRPLRRAFFKPMDVILATATRLPRPDEDDAPLHVALAARGARAATVAWDDPAADWSARAVVLRSTWNYVPNLAAFLPWVERTAAATALWNPAPVVRWNHHKGYLLELAARGVTVTPTRLLPRGAQTDVDALLGEWPDLVLKPAVSAGSFGTLRVRGDHHAARAHLAAFQAERDLLAQPYLPSVEEHGERSLVWIDGVFSHAVRKAPRFAGDRQAITGPVEIAADERALAEAALATAPGPLLYARVDVARDADGRPCVMELELIEPSLFLSFGAGAADRLAAAILRRL